MAVLDESMSILDLTCPSGAPWGRSTSSVMRRANQTSSAPGADASPAFLSTQITEARRYYRNQYYESIAGGKALARERGEPVIDAPTNPVIKKSF